MKPLIIEEALMGKSSSSHSEKRTMKILDMHMNTHTGS